uniref:CSON003371 protein n=1 Tax=Culicoides sonorensis TaxID=179676 RepID=A0A336L2R4_CULSO
MELRCLTCDIQLEASSGNDLKSAVPECKSASLIEIYKNCLSLDGAETDVICDGCKVHLILFYQFKLKVIGIQLKRLGAKPKPDKEVDLKSEENIRSEIKEAPKCVPEKVTTETQKNEYLCAHCPATFLVKRTVKHHILSRHLTSESFSCAECPDIFKSYQELQCHKRDFHTIKSFICESCGKGFKTSSELRAHLKSKHENPSFKRKSKLIACDVCAKVLSSRSALQRHKALLHGIGTVILPVKCEICNKSWPSNSALQNHHLSIHTDERNFTCAICEKKFATKNLLTTHINRVHCPTKDFICDTCGKTFKTQLNLNGHYRVHSSEKSFICTNCGASFKQEASLFSHMKMHRDKLAGITYDCQICQSTFASSRSLKQHAKIHVGPDLQCGHCTKTFKVKQALSRHILTKHNNVQFRVICTICGKFLWNRRVMRDHVKEKHPDVIRENPGKSVDEYLKNIKRVENNSELISNKNDKLQVLSVQILNVCK